MGGLRRHLKDRYGRFYRFCEYTFLLVVFTVASYVLISALSIRLHRDIARARGMLTPGVKLALVE